MSDPKPLLELIDAYRRSKTMFAALELGIFDGARPRGAAVDRLLDACASLGLLEKHGSEYVNTPIADEYLRGSSPRSLAGYVRYANSSLYPLWAHLEDAVLEGTQRWRQTFGLRGIAARFFRMGKKRRDFAAGMHGLGLITSPNVVAAFDLSRFRRLVDVGGATGHLALAARDRYPEMQTAVFDLPPVIGLAREFAGGRAELFGGNFFTDPLPPADLYVLGKVLHGLTDEAARRLLAKINAALPEAGGVLIAERLLDEESPGPAAVALHSLSMLVATGGRERSFTEYRALLESAGFHQVQSKKLDTPLDAILALVS